MIVNTFIITPKPEWRDATCLVTPDIKGIMAHMLPEKYQMLFKSLIKDSLNEVMDNRDHQKAYTIMAQAMLSGQAEAWYAKNTSECLLHIIRKMFYDTLLILHNDYNPHKYDYIIVTLSREIISERKWEELKNIKPSNGNGKVLTANFRNGT